MEKSNKKGNWVRGVSLGRGSYGTVNLASINDQIFAVKSVSRRFSCKSQLEALENEISILRAISSPWVVEYLGDDITAETDGAAEFRNLHLEYMPGGTVADMAKRCGNDVDESLVRSYTWCIVSALKSVHGKGIVHCDVKGNNVLIGSVPGVAKLADFGSATEFYSTAVKRGSPLWMAPEVIRGEYQGPESDVWSLGCTVIEMMAGNPGWEDRGGETLHLIGYSDKLPEIPNGFSELSLDFIGKCLQRDRSKRWSCDQLLLHPFISASAPLDPTRSSPRCVLDWSDLKYIDDDEEDENRDEKDRLRSVSHSGRERIGNLACSEGAIWESDGWITVRNGIKDSGERVEEGTERNILRRSGGFVGSELHCLEVDTAELNLERRWRWRWRPSPEAGGMKFIILLHGLVVYSFLRLILQQYVMVEMWNKLLFVPIIGFKFSFSHQSSIPRLIN